MTEHHHYHPPLTARIDYCSPDVHVNYNNYIHEIQDIQSQLKIFIRFNQHISSQFSRHGMYAYHTQYTMCLNCLVNKLLLFLSVRLHFSLVNSTAQHVEMQVIAAVKSAFSDLYT